MAFGDVGGMVTELVITCRTPSAGEVAIAKGDAVKLSGAYEITNSTSADDVVFGQALAAADENDVAVPVMVRGIAVFAYDGAAPSVNGSAGVLASAVAGKVKAPGLGNGVGVNVKVDTNALKVHVLL